MEIRSMPRRAWRRIVLGSRASRGAPDRPEHVLSFWFGRPPGPRFTVVDALWLPSRIPCWGGHWASRALDVDEIIRTELGPLHELATRGELDSWCDDAHGRLAWVILLDQISRNIHRGTPAAFANDVRVLPVVERALAERDDRRFNPLARTLFYLPLMHHEDVALVRRCLELYEAAHADARGLARTVLRVELASGRRHAEILERFGRYPHRNEILGRASTPDERAFLEQHFSSF